MWRWREERSYRRGETWEKEERVERERKSVYRGKIGCCDRGDSRGQSETVGDSRRQSDTVELKKRGQSAGRGD